MRVAPTPVKRQIFSVSQNLCGWTRVFDLAGGFTVAGVAGDVPGLSCANSATGQAKRKATNKRMRVLSMRGILTG